MDIDGNEKRVQEIGNAKLVDHTLSTSPNAPDIREQVTKIAGKGVDVVINCVGAQNTIRDAFTILNKGGALVMVAMFGNELKIISSSYTQRILTPLFTLEKITMNCAKS